MLSQDKSYFNQTIIENNNNNNIFTNNKHRRFFGKKIKLTEWPSKNEINSQKKNEVDIIDYINSRSKVEKNELYQIFKINPSQTEIDLLNSVLKVNPMINIRKRERDYLLRIKIRKTKFTRKFIKLKEAQELRNILLLYSMSNDPKFMMHLTKRNKISEANKKKNNFQNNIIYNNKINNNVHTINLDESD
jgi:hypothetical protein